MISQLELVYRSNVPVDCYILQGRLASEGIDSYVFDDEIVWTDMAYSVAVGGVKLKVQTGRVEDAIKIIQQIKNGYWLNKENVEAINDFNSAFEYQDELLRVKVQLRQSPVLIKTIPQLKHSLLEEDLQQVVLEEIRYLDESQKTLNFSFKELVTVFFDSERSVFRYLRPKSNWYYLEKELVAPTIKTTSVEVSTSCPACGSDNTKKGHAIGKKWDILYLIIGLLFQNVLPPIRRSYWCFDCSHNF